MGFFSALTGGFSNIFGGGSGGSGGPIEHAINTTVDVGKTWLNYNMAKHQFKDQMGLARDQFQFQQDLAKKQMQWRVEDAKAAGLHPLAVLGLSPSSFSPVSAGSPTAALDTSSLSNLGQNIDRAIMAGKNSEQQQEAIDYLKRDAELTLENKQLQNELVKAELADKTFRLIQQMSPPAPTVNSAPGIIGGQVDSTSLRTGLRSPEKSAYHVWDMGNGNFDILMNPDYQTTIGDEFGQVATTLKAIARAKQGVWINPEDGVTYVFDRDSGYFKRLSSLSNEEASRLLGSPSSRSSGVDSSFHERNKYRYR